MKELDAPSGLLLEVAHPRDLKPERILDRRRRDPGLEILAGDAERRELVERKIDASPIKILADIADEIRELERDSEILGTIEGLGS
ncbi:unannotated protein [freshwater metagenome]|uniref:Unannotated protein n=1 Tax=freshwater metagenome TaxID=449393 RepID=A0A6J7EQB8_9ZZZZ